MSYRGQPTKFEFQYRDPWEYILTLIHDKSLASVSCWNAVRKLYCYQKGNVEERIIDEPNTADTWWEVDVSHQYCARSVVWGQNINYSQSSLLNDGPYAHCYLPLHFWLDKGLVTRRVKKYPMILRAAWLPRRIRNASGNGGGILLGYLPIVSRLNVLH